VPEPTKTMGVMKVKFLGLLRMIFTGKKLSLGPYMDKLYRNRRIGIKKLKSAGFVPEVKLEPAIDEVIDTFKDEGLM